MFSPSFITSAWRVASTLSPEASRARVSASTSVMPPAAASSATAFANPAEILVLGDEVVLAVHFHQRTQLAVARQVNADRAFGSDPAGDLARLCARS